MDSLMESNERTLVIFESVTSGLASCLALVHADIKQMTEHRGRLAQDEQRQLQAKLVSAHELALAAAAKRNAASGQCSPYSARRHSPGGSSSAATNNTAGSGRSAGSTADQCRCCRDQVDDDDDDLCTTKATRAGQLADYDHPAGLAELGLLDKRLADSFSRALSLNDLQKSSLKARQHVSKSRTNLFQVLLAKTTGGSASSTFGGLARRRNKSSASMQSALSGQCDKSCQTPCQHQHHQATAKPLDNRAVIDDINKQIRLAMQYSKQLETHLLKVEDLRTKYEMHLKMGLVGWVAPAANGPRHGSSALTEAANKTTIKEFVANIDKIESEFESFMGSFLLAVEDIQGFARVCQGDVFEISIKYGDCQKFKSRITVLRDNRQKCDNVQAIFKARISDRISIKAYECKGLGKRLLLGHKFCETRDLFTARSQLMTISLNQTGSIKLNLIVTWNPLHMAPSSPSSMPGIDLAHISLPPTPVSSSTLSSTSSQSNLSHSNQTTTTINIQSQPNHHHQHRIVANSPNRTPIHTYQHSTPPPLVSAPPQQPPPPIPHHNVIQSYHHNHHRSLSAQQQQLHSSFYRPSEPHQQAGFYVPPPDYLTNEINY